MVYLQFFLPVPRGLSFDTGTFKPQGTETVVDIAVGNPVTFLSLVDFFTQADLVDSLSNANGITVFAPTNDAFTVGSCQGYI
ncbi:MAG: putative surface protein with fasciclin (FAS1) repeats [Bacillariaceae sp.]|jgi:uncharacterized surface protein with fasciclin (FAS1) repeats